MMTEILDELFGTDNPDWTLVHELVALEGSPEDTLAVLLKLAWLEAHDPEAFDRMICELV